MSGSLPSAPSNLCRSSGLRHLTPNFTEDENKTSRQKKLCKARKRLGRDYCLSTGPPKVGAFQFIQSLIFMAFASPTDGTFQNKPHTAQSKMKQAAYSQKPSSKGIPQAFILQPPPAKGLSDYRIWPGGFQSPPLFHFSLS